MDETVENILIAADKFLLLKCLWDSQDIYQHKLDKACFQRHMVYEDFNDLTKRTAPDKILRDKAFNIVKNPKYDEYQVDLIQWSIYFFDKETSDSGIKMRIFQKKNKLKGCTNKLLENLKKVKYTQLL